MPTVSVRQTLTIGYGNLVTIDPVEPAWGCSMMQTSSRCSRGVDSGVLALSFASREAAFPAGNVPKLTSDDILQREIIELAFFERGVAKQPPNVPGGGISPRRKLQKRVLHL